MSCPTCHCGDLGDDCGERCYHPWHMTHDAVRSTVGEQLCKLTEYGRSQGSWSLSLVHDEAGDYHGMFNFGAESPGSDMVAGSSLAYGRSLVEVLGQMVAECRL